jgi:nucleoside-diphosphate-sugar epimerase
MTILLTGSTGFIGQHIFTSVSRENKVITIGRRNCDILYDFKSVIKSIPNADLLIHCAGLAHIEGGDEQINEMLHQVNVEYSINLLKSIQESNSKIKALVLISSVSVYGLENGYLINEKSELRPRGYYGISKLMCEEAFINWSESNNVRLTILRLPLVVGIGARGNLERMIDAIKKGYYFNIGKGHAKKSMVLINDVANIVIDASKVGGIYNLTDGYHPTFYELSHSIARQLGKNKVKSFPLFLVQVLAFIGDLIGRKAPMNSIRLNKMTSSLTYDDSSARLAFNWNPTPILEEFKIKNP